MKLGQPFALRNRLPVIAAVVALAATLCGIGTAHASVTYTYEGLNFTTVTGSAPTVTTANRITGFVEFATAPTPNETGKNDWIAFELSDGARTLSSANGDSQFYLGDSFDFDALLNIVDWFFSVVPDSESSNANIISTGSGGDLSRLNAGSVQHASTNAGGTWTREASVPEPGTLFLFAVGLGLIALYGVRRNPAGGHRSSEGAA